MDRKVKSDYTSCTRIYSIYSSIKLILLVQEFTVYMCVYILIKLILLVQEFTVFIYIERELN